MSPKAKKRAVLANLLRLWRDPIYILLQLSSLLGARLRAPLQGSACQEPYTMVSGLYFVGGAGAPSVCRGGSGLYFISELCKPPLNNKELAFQYIYNWGIELWVHSQGPLAAYAPPTKYRPDTTVY